MYRYIVLATVIACAMAQEVKFKDCGSKDGKISSVQVVPCPQEPCLLKHGTNVTIFVNFTSSVDTTNATTKVYGILGGIPVSFPTVPADCCTNKNMPCPVKAGDNVAYHNYVYVNPTFPKVRVLVQWEILDDKNNQMTCFIIPATITD